MEVWARIMYHFKISHWETFISLESCFKWWFHPRGIFKPLPLLVTWEIWKACNKFIFYDKPLNPFHIFSRVLAWLSIVAPPSWNFAPHRFLSPPTQVSFLASFFDEVAQNKCCGCGVWLTINHWCGDSGTNQKVKVMTL